MLWMVAFTKLANSIDADSINHEVIDREVLDRGLIDRGVIDQKRPIKCVLTFTGLIAFG